MEKQKPASFRKRASAFLGWDQRPHSVLHWVVVHVPRASEAVFPAAWARPQASTQGRSWQTARHCEYPSQSLPAPQAVFSLAHFCVLQSEQDRGPASTPESMPASGVGHELDAVLHWVLHEPQEPA